MDPRRALRHCRSALQVALLPHGMPSLSVQPRRRPSWARLGILCAGHGGPTNDLKTGAALRPPKDCEAVRPKCQLAWRSSSSSSSSRSSSSSSAARHRRTELRRRCDRRDTRRQRLARRTSRREHFRSSGPASAVAAARGDDLAGPASPTMEAQIRCRKIPGSTAPRSLRAQSADRGRVIT